MIFYITVLRAIAAILITNAHYTGVYPIEIIANGGLLGDVIFFAVSGFCLFYIKDSFFKWYGKRILRIYPAVWVITLLYLAIGFYNFKDGNLFQYLIYPTNYHFIASIVLLYVFYYFIIKNRKANSNLPIVMVGISILQVILYVFFYDKSYYHIDNVREWMIRFIFLQSMLLGAYFRKNHEKYRNRNRLKNWILLFIFFMIYFFTKLLFSKGYFVELQIINQVTLFIVLYYFFKCLSGVDMKLEKIPIFFKKMIELIASITLEIYLVQYPIIPRLASLTFPFNWIVITLSILISAYILYFIINKLMCLWKEER